MGESRDLRIDQSRDQSGVILSHGSMVHLYSIITVYYGKVHFRHCKNIEAVIKLGFPRTQEKFQNFVIITGYNCRVFTRKFFLIFMDSVFTSPGKNFNFFDWKFFLDYQNTLIIKKSEFFLRCGNPNHKRFWKFSWAPYYKKSRKFWKFVLGHVETLTKIDQVKSKLWS